MKESEITKFLVAFNGQIEYVSFPGGIFDDKLYFQYEMVWGPDWDPVSGLVSGTSQMARSGNDPEKVVFNMPVETTFSSTNVSGWPQLVITVRAQNPISGDSLRGYALVLMPPTTGTRIVTSSLVRPQAATLLGEWLAWITGRYPELAEPKMLASGKENYLWTGEEYPMKVIKVYKDDAFWHDKMLPKLKTFYYDCVLPELIDPRKTRSMPLRQIFL